MTAAASRQHPTNFRIIPPNRSCNHSGQASGTPDSFRDAHLGLPSTRTLELAKIKFRSVLQRLRAALWLIRAY